jgi:catechol 2,3-dioxygenase-like lactoylglutathione lyase family enzyme
MLADVTIQRMDNLAIVVDDLDAAVAFFTELGMELEGKGQVEGVLGGPHRRTRRRPERHRDDADPESLAKALDCALALATSARGPEADTLIGECSKSERRQRTES